MANNCNPDDLKKAAEKIAGIDQAIEALGIKPVSETAAVSELRIGGKSIPEISGMSLDDAVAHFEANADAIANLNLYELGLIDLPHDKAIKMYATRGRVLRSRLEASDAFKALTEDERNILLNNMDRAAGKKSTRHINDLKAYSTARDHLGGTASSYDLAIDALYMGNRGYGGETSFMRLLRAAQKEDDVDVAGLSKLFGDNSAGLIAGEDIATTLPTSSLKYFLYRQIYPNLSGSTLNLILDDASDLSAYERVARKVMQSDKSVIEAMERTPLYQMEVYHVERLPLPVEMKSEVLTARDAIFRTRFLDSIKDMKVSNLVEEGLANMLQLRGSKNFPSEAFNEAMRFVNKQSSEIIDYFNEATRYGYKFDEAGDADIAWNIDDYNSFMAGYAKPRKAGDIPVDEWEQIIDEIPKVAFKRRARAQRIVDNLNANGYTEYNPDKVLEILDMGFDDTQSLNKLITELGPRLEDSRLDIAIRESDRAKYIDTFMKKADDGSETVGSFDVEEITAGFKVDDDIAKKVDPKIQAKVDAIDADDAVRPGGQETGASKDFRAEMDEALKKEAEEVVEAEPPKKPAAKKSKSKKSNDDVEDIVSEPAPRAAVPFDKRAAEVKKISEDTKLQNKILRMNAADFNRLIQDTIEAYGNPTNAEPVIHAYLKVAWHGTADHPGLADKILNSKGRLLGGNFRRLTTEQKDWIRGLGDKINYKSDWSRRDAEMLIQTYNRVDADTGYYMLRYFAPGLFVNAAYEFGRRPVPTVLKLATGYTFVLGTIGMFGFFLEEAVQATIQMGVPFYIDDADVQSKFFMDNMEASIRAHKVWQPFHNFIKSVPGGNIIFFPLAAIDFYMTEVVEAQVKTRSRSYKDHGLMKDSNTNCMTLLNGGEYCAGELTTYDERVNHILAHPGHLGVYSSEFKKQILGIDQGGMVDPQTGMGENNVWAKKAGLTGQAALDIGYAGVIDLGRRGASDKFNDFTSIKSLLFGHEVAGDVRLQGIRNSTNYLDLITGMTSGTATASSSGTATTTTAVTSGTPVAVVPGEAPQIVRDIARLTRDQRLSTLNFYASTNKEAAAAWRNYYTNEDGTIDIARIKKDNPDFTDTDIKTMFSDDTYKAGIIKSLEQSPDIITMSSSLAALVKDGTVLPEDINKYIPAKYRAEWDRAQGDPRNFENAQADNANNIIWTNASGYTTRKSIVDSAGLVYNPITGTWDSQIKSMLTNPDGSVWELDVGKYAEFLRSKGGPNKVTAADLQAFLATSPYNCTYKCGGSSSSSAKSTGHTYSGGGGSSKSSYKKSYTDTYSKTGKTGVIVYANYLQADIYEGSKLIGQTDSGVIEMDPGDHTLTIKKDGYITKDLTVTVLTGKVVTKWATLTKGSDQAKVTICDFVDDIGALRLNGDHLAYVFARYKGWAKLEAQAYAACSPKSVNLPATLTKDDVYYILNLVLGQTAVAANMVTNGRVCKGGE